MSARSTLVDLSHAIEDGLITYPGLPAPVIAAHLTRASSRNVYAAGTEFEIGSITMVGNTGTYLDSPYHRYADGPDLADLPLDRLVGLPATVVHLDALGHRGISADDLSGAGVEGKAVLLHTGWDRHFGTPAYGVGAPFLTEDASRHLIHAGAVLVGIDSVNIDDTESGGARPAHTLLLAAGLPIVEHLTRLDTLPAIGARFTAVPPKVRGFGTFPVRAFAELP
jgi:kynurenine formamidase